VEKTREKMKAQNSIALILIVIMVMAIVASAEQTQARPPIGIVEHLGQSVPMDVEMYDESGNLVTTKDVINKPTIITFVYFKCPGICSPLLNELSHTVEKMDLELGKDYQILTLSFDHSEKPELAADKKDNYLSSIKRHVDPSGWRFFTSDSVNIHKFTDAAGFYFKRDSAAWLHAGALIIVSREGKITRYINGITYLPFDVKMAVIEASEGKVSPTIANVLKFCFSYNPESRSYALNFTRIAMVVVLLLVGLFVVLFILKPRVKNIERQVPYGRSV
jgi:protein SCO1/2